MCDIISSVFLHTRYVTSVIIAIKGEILLLSVWYMLSSIREGERREENSGTMHFALS